MPVTTEADALGHMVPFLRELLAQRPGIGRMNVSSHVLQDGTPVFHVHDVIDVQLNAVMRAQQERNAAAGRRGPASYSHDYSTNIAPYLDAAWGLVRRGVLRPTPLADGTSVSLVVKVFAVTAYGRSWLTRADDVIPADTGRLGQLLVARGARLGAGFRSRSQEAVACYQAYAYLACCTMSGAAAESITLALSIGRATRAGRDEESVLTEYRKARGRSAIEQYLTAQRNPHVRQELSSFLTLLNYWRDEAAHGAGSSIAEDEASVALLLLLRYAIFADTRWDDMTAP